jgi:hypothetical protein
VEHITEKCISLSVYQCPLKCSDKTLNKEEMYRHLASEECSNLTWKCTICDGAIKNDSEFATHLCLWKQRVREWESKYKVLQREMN